MVVPNKPSTDRAAVKDQWTQHCLDRASRRALWWTLAAISAFGLQLVLVFVLSWSSALAFVLLIFAAVVLFVVLRRRPLRLPAGEPWQFAEARWEGGRLVVLGSPPLMLSVRVGPLARSRVTRHRRVWLVAPDSRGNTVVTFRGVPRLFEARVFR